MNRMTCVFNFRGFRLSTLAAAAGTAMWTAPPVRATVLTWVNAADVNPDDMGDFISCYFATSACTAADFNGDGSVNPDDLGDYITTFFAGACG